MTHPAEDPSIQTPAGLKITFNDGDKSITISTPAGNTITLSDGTQSVEITDQSGNYLKMSQGGITLNSTYDININAARQVSISGSQGINLKSSGGELAASAMNVKLTADIQASVHGNQILQLDGGMQATLRAAMVMIN